MLQSQTVHLILYKFMTLIQFLTRKSTERYQKKSLISAQRLSLNQNNHFDPY